MHVDLNVKIHWYIYIHNKCTKSPPTCFGTLWVQSLGSLHSSSSSAFQIDSSVQQSHTLAHVLKL